MPDPGKESPVIDSVVLTAPLRDEDLDDTAHQAAIQMTAIKKRADWHTDVASWEMADIYVRAYAIIAGLHRQQFGELPTTSWINDVIRGKSRDALPASSWLSNARGIKRAFPDLFAPGHQRILSYDSYRRIANCALKAPGAKTDLRCWAEDNRPSRRALCEEINRRVDEELGLHLAVFVPQTGTVWRLAQPDKDDDQIKVVRPLQGSGLHPDLVANLLYHFSLCDQRVLNLNGHSQDIDHVVELYTAFREKVTDLPRSGPRRVETVDALGLQRDADPAQLCIAEAHAPDADLPWADIRGALAENGVLALIADDLVHGDGQPLAFPLLAQAQAAGFRLLTPIYVPQPRRVAPVPLPDLSGKLHFQKLTLIWILTPEAADV